MPIELKITAADTYEFDLLMRRFLPEAVVSVAETVVPVEARGSTAAEAETPLDPPATKTRQRKPKDEPVETPEASPAPTVSAPETPAAAVDEHPMLVSKTLADVKALGNKKVSELGAGPIQQLLVESFGVRNFGSLDAADLDRAYAALEALK